MSQYDDLDADVDRGMKEEDEGYADIPAVCPYCFANVPYHSEFCNRPQPMQRRSK